MGKRGHTKVSQGIGDPDLRVGVMVQTPSGIQPVLAQLSARYGSTLCFLRLQNDYQEKINISSERAEMAFSFGTWLSAVTGT